MLYHRFRYSLLSSLTGLIRFLVIFRVMIFYVMSLLRLFIPEKISRDLHKTRTPRINGTKSTFTAYSAHGQLKPQLILAEGFGAKLIQAAAFFGRESVRINALKRCPRLAEAYAENQC